MEFGVNLEFPHSSLVFHARIPRTKQRSSQQTVIFIVFTAELLQYSTESHEIKLLLKTRPKKNKTQKTNKKNLLYGCYCKFISMSCTYRDP